MKNIDQLKSLKEKLDNHKMSVLVGAGFSKNVSTIFPSWWELLFDMAYFLFQDDIEDAFENALSKLKKGETLDKNEYITKKVNIFINKVGYLDIVSEYIKRKGFREAIATYIEEKTPKVVQIGNKNFLENYLGGKNNKVEINNEMLSQHKLLLRLPWNNIYTTNYDEMLEIACDSSTTNNLESEIKEIKNEIKNLYEEEVELSQKIENIKLKEEGKSPYSSINPELNSLNWSHIRIKKLIIDKERELILLNTALNETLTLVTDSSQLSIKRNKNIIKLHGTLRDKDSSYGFDGDNQNQYVIARDDYETYPLKHEAFTQLMRISLLQESYCLIGFSGVDTNFIEWIKWVREILERSKKGHNKSEYKIYLIDMSANDIDKEKLLFFENHRVYRIPLMKDNVIDFLETKTESTIKDRKSKKNVLELFLHFLTGGSNFNYSKTTFELRQKNKYNKLWESIDFNSPENVKIENIIKISDEIIKLKQFNRLPSIHFAYSNIKHSLLFWANSLLKKSNDNNSTNLLLDLLTSAIKDTFLSIRFIWGNDDFNEIYLKAKDNSQIKREFDLFRLRQSVLEANKNEFNLVLSKIKENKTDDVFYESALLLAFTFDFKNLKKTLNNWIPNSHYLIKKAGLLAHFEITEAKDLVLKHYLLSENEISQEQLYTLHLYNYMKQNIDYGFDKKLQDKIQLYKNSGLKDIHENLDIIEKDLNQKQEKIKPYGDGRFTVSNGFSFSNDFSKPQKGLQFIQILIESGFPLSLPSVHLKSYELWYPIFKSFFEYYPYPALFFSLQYSNEKFLKRIGQDFAYSEALKDDLNKILPLLLNLYLSKYTPVNFKKSILWFCSELFIAVDPLKWEELFEKIWKTNFFIHRAFNKRHYVEYSFVNAALPYIQNFRIIQAVIDNAIINLDSSISIDYLYNLSNNQLFQEKGEKIQNYSLSKRLNKLINNLSTNENEWFIIGNLNSILTTKQIEKINKTIVGLNFNNIKNERIWKVLIFYAIKHPKTIKIIRTAIIKNERLWDAGFIVKGLSSKHSFIEITKLRKTKIRIDGITWNKKETNLIYQKLKKELQKIENWLVKRPDHSFKFILQEMLSFLDYEKVKLENLSDFNSVYDRIKNLYYKDRGYNNLVSGLLSSDNTHVVWALSELSEAIYENSSLDCNFEISILLNKVLLQADSALEACLKMVSAFVCNTNSTELLKPYSQLLQMILRKYEEQELLECDKPFVQLQLII